jgi:hypothetical protein
VNDDFALPAAGLWLPQSLTRTVPSPCLLKQHVSAGMQTSQLPLRYLHLASLSSPSCPYPSGLPSISFLFIDIIPHRLRFDLEPGRTANSDTYFILSSPLESRRPTALAYRLPSSVSLAMSASSRPCTAPLHGFDHSTCVSYKSSATWRSQKGGTAPFSRPSGCSLQSWKQYYGYEDTSKLCESFVSSDRQSIQNKRSSADSHPRSPHCFSAPKYPQHRIVPIRNHLSPTLLLTLCIEHASPRQSCFALFYSCND